MCKIEIGAKRKSRFISISHQTNNKQQAGNGIAWNNEIIILPSLGTIVNSSCLLNSILYFNSWILNDFSRSPSTSDNRHPIRYFHGINFRYFLSPKSHQMLSNLFFRYRTVFPFPFSGLTYLSDVMFFILINFWSTMSGEKWLTEEYNLTVKFVTLKRWL